MLPTIARDWIFKIDSGYSNDPQNPRGETKYGISKKTYPNLDMVFLSKTKANELYYNDYWLQCWCHKMPKKIALVVFDSAVIHGKKRAIKILQKVCKVKIDGQMGPKTLAASQNKSKIRKRIRKILICRSIIYATNKKMKHYYYGWTNRLFLLLELVLKKWE